MSDEEREKVIREVLLESRRKEEVREFQRLRYDRERRRRGLGLRHLVLVVTLFATAWVWLQALPLLRVPPPRPPPVRYLDASARLALYLQAQEIESYRAATGSLPEDLDEVGGGLPGIRYFRTVRETYHLETLTDDFARFYSSSLAQTPEEYLGTAEEWVFPVGFWEEGE